MTNSRLPSFAALVRCLLGSTPAIVSPVLLLLGSVFQPHPVHAQPPMMPEEVLLIRKNADRLRTGEYVASGTFGESWKGVPNPEWSEEKSEQRLRNGKPAERDAAIPQSIRVNREYDELIESAFDFTDAKFAFRRTLTQTSGDGFAPGNMRTRWFVSTVDHTLLVYGNNRPQLQVAIFPPVFSPAEGEMSGEPVYDPRSIAWGSLHGVQYRYWTQFLEDADPQHVQVVDEGNGIRRLEVFTPYPGAKDGAGLLSTWRLDETQGFQPTRFERQNYYSKPTTPFYVRLNEAAKPSDVAEFSWTETDGVWILLTLDMWCRYGNSTNRLQLTFDWKSVNQPVAETHFDWRHWDLPELSTVSDVRGERPIRIKSVPRGERSR